MHRGGRHYYAKTQSIKGFQPEIIDTLIEQGLPFSSPFIRSITFMEPRAASVRRKLLLLRQDHLMVELIAAWGHRTTSSGIFNGHKTSHRHLHLMP